MSVFLDDTRGLNLTTWTFLSDELMITVSCSSNSGTNWLPVEANRSRMCSRPPLTVVALTWLAELMSQHCKEQRIPKLQGQEILNEHAGLRALVRWLKVERTAFTPQRLRWGLVTTGEKSLQPPASFSSAPPLRQQTLHSDDYRVLVEFICRSIQS